MFSPPRMIMSSPPDDVAVALLVDDREIAVCIQPPESMAAQVRSTSFQ